TIHYAWTLCLWERSNPNFLLTDDLAEYPEKKILAMFSYAFSSCQVV
ncbi:16802_t:CDS:1, partial [Dentiscutata heterogama]